MMHYSDDASSFVLLSEAVPDAILEIRYHSTYNFVGDRIEGYEEPIALLTKEAAYALRKVSEEMIRHGYRLKVFDAYRPQMAVSHFMRWAQSFEDTRMKKYFYPSLEKEQLIPQGYIAEHSGHTRGSTIDLTLFDMTAEKEVDMGGPFDFFGEISHPDCRSVTEEQYRSRMRLRGAMLAHGFKPIEEEWWHFTLAEEPFPDTYFTFPVCRASVEGTNALYAASQPVADSPDWVKALPAAQDADQLFVVAASGIDQTTACVTMHERNASGVWKQILSTPGFVGKNGLCPDADHFEGCGRTPMGVYRFNQAFGIAADPGCALPYVQADENTYWSGDPARQYNRMVSIRDVPELNKDESEHILDYAYQYRYCLNISFNEEGTPGRGSAIFLHCFGVQNPWTGGCVAIPEYFMKQVIKSVRRSCVVVIGTMEGLNAGR